MQDFSSADKKPRPEPKPPARATDPRPVPPDTISFDLHAEDLPGFHDLEDTQVIDTSVFPDQADVTGDDDFDYDGDTDTDDDPPPAGAPALLVPPITRPSVAPVESYTVCAMVIQVDPDGEENWLGGHVLHETPLRTRTLAVGLANYKAQHAERFHVPGVTHVVVNNERGHEVYRRAVRAA